MKDDAGLAVAGGLLVVGALQGVAQRTAGGIEREFSLYFDGRRHRLRERGNNAGDAGRLLLGVSLVVYLFGRRWQENRKSDPADEIATTPSV